MEASPEHQTILFPKNKRWFRITINIQEGKFKEQLVQNMNYAIAKVRCVEGNPEAGAEKKTIYDSNGSHYKMAAKNIVGGPKDHSAAPLEGQNRRVLILLY